MGGSARGKLATGEEAKISEQSMTNVGLVNLADTGESTGFTFNFVEAATCGIAFLITLFLLRWCCIKKRRQNLLRIQHGMQEAMRAVVVDPHVGRLPVLGAHNPSPQPPFPPAAQLPPYSGPAKPSTEQLGAAIMKNYC